MPVKTVMDRENDITTHTVTGEVVDPEMFEAERAFYEEGPTRLQFWDLTECDISGITITGMRTFVERAARLGKARPEGKTAVLVRSQLQYGLARMAEAFGEFAMLPFQFRIFRDRDEAMAWLGEGHEEARDGE